MLNIHWKDRCWSWSFTILATWCEEPIHWKRPWCWQRLRTGGGGNNRGWDNWMASLTQWTWVWASSGRWWRTGKPGILQSMGSKRVGHDGVTEQQLESLILLNFPLKIRACTWHIKASSFSSLLQYPYFFMRYLIELNAPLYVSSNLSGMQW